MDKSTELFLKKKAVRIRQNILREIGTLGVGHVGGSMSIVEALVILYYKVMKIDPKDPNWGGRDRLVLSKGHAGPALYAVFADIGFIPEEWLDTLNQPETKLPSHCDRLVTPGVDMTNGSLGQGLSAAIGMAMAAKMDKKDINVYCILGDGELQEGQVWEALMFGGNKRLDNLIVFVDYNKMQIDAPIKDLNDLEPLEEKLKAFKWHTQSVDGHNVKEIYEAIEKAKAKKDQSSIIILNTIKGKGAYFAEGKLSCHNMKVSKDEWLTAHQLLEEEVRKYE